MTRPKLLEMAWFERLYEFIMALRAKATALVEPIKQPDPRHAARRRRRLVIAHAAADPALPQERARSAVAAHCRCRLRLHRPSREVASVRAGERLAPPIDAITAIARPLAGMKGVGAAIASMQMQQMRRVEAERGDDDSDQRQQRPIPRPARSCR